MLKAKNNVYDDLSSYIMHTEAMKVMNLTLIKNEYLNMYYFKKSYTHNIPHCYFRLTHAVLLDGTFLTQPAML